jgi:hypothetical protein
VLVKRAIGANAVAKRNVEVEQHEESLVNSHWSLVKRREK